MAETTQTNINWQQAIEKLLTENLQEQKRRRRWGIIFKTLFLIYALIFLALLIIPVIHRAGNLARPHTSVVDIDGMIMPNGNNNANNVVEGLTKAFKDPKTVAIILRINSPGGSPVQSADIYNSIVRLRHKYPTKKVYAVCSDICASGAYYVAAAANDIYANPSSLVGSIGVMLNGFGFVGTMDKLGVQRRLITSGKSKDFLDPFSPMKAQDKEYAKKLLDIVHQQFIKDVEKGRGKRLKKNPQLFSGLVWTGIQAKNLGLIDGFGSAGYVARNIIKNKNIVNYTKRKSIFEKISQGIGASFAHELLASFTQANLQ